jgi:type IV secretion system protein VirD4
MKHSPNVQAPRRTGAFSLIPLALFLIVTVASFWIATEWAAGRLGYQPRLGVPWLQVGHAGLYAPWAIFGWIYWYSSYAEAIFQRAFVITAVGPMIGVVVIVAYSVWRARKARVATTHGTARFATDFECRAAELTGRHGVVLGVLPTGRLLRDNGLEHVACIAPTRSGKGVGQVIPTLLSWTGSVLVHDMKGENWAITSAWRAKFSNVIYFNPTDPECSAHFNPLLEVRDDENQIRDVQNIADQIVDPYGKGKESHWDRTADQFLLGAILHVLHAEPDKSLYGLSKFLSDPKRTFEATLKHMKAVPHDKGIAHERIAAAAQAMINKSEEERSGILSTTLAFLGLYSDPIVARNTADSDFRILDLMQAAHPMSLYIVVPDSDRLRLKPLTRMLMTMITQRLVEKQNPKANKHRLLMLIDEFPRLGKLPFFTDALSYLAGYNIKVMLVMQSKAQLDTPEAHGVGNTVIESCRVRSVYTPQDPATAQWISDTLGPKTEVHQQTTYTGHRLAPWLGHVMVADQESARPLLDAAEICKLPASDMILLVAGAPPILARRFRYYEHALFAERANLPPLELKAGGPYPFRPRQHPNPWAGRRSGSPKDGGGSPPVAAPAPRPPNQPAPAAEDSDRSQLAVALTAKAQEPEAMAPPHLDRQAMEPTKLEEQLDLLTSEEELDRRRALDEHERLNQHRPHRARRRIPM